jgi:hypothetical protein
MQRKINHNYCKKFKKPSLKNPLTSNKKMLIHEKKKPTLDQKQNNPKINRLK